MVLAVDHRLCGNRLSFKIFNFISVPQHEETAGGYQSHRLASEFESHHSQARIVTPDSHNFEKLRLCIPLCS